MVALVAVGCSSDSEVAGAPTVIGGLDATESEPIVSSTTTTPPVLEPADPVVRSAENPEPIVEGNWVARTFMDDTRVDIVWSPVDGAETYRLYRLPTVEADYEAIALGEIDGADEVYEGPEFGFVDPDVPANTFLPMCWSPRSVTQERSRAGPRHSRHVTWHRRPPSRGSAEP